VSEIARFVAVKVVADIRKRRKSHVRRGCDGAYQQFPSRSL